MMPNPSKKLTIGLLWHSTSSDNLGVGALTASHVQLLDECATRAGVSVAYILFGTSGSQTLPLSPDRVREGGRISLKRMLLHKTTFLRDLRECDVVFDIGEGDSFTDIYGVKRYMRLLWTKAAVLLLRRPLILSPQTIGPFKIWWTRVLAVCVMNRAAKVFARDRVSRDYLHSVGVVRNAACSTDVAFRLPYQQSERKGNATRIGLNISGLLYSGGYTGKNQFDLTVDYRKLVNRLIEYWLRMPNCEVWLVPHVLSSQIPREDDRRANAEVAALYPCCKVAPEFKNPIEAKSFISSLDFLTGARMHACIAALSAGVPVVPFAYSRKFEGLFSTLNYPLLVDGQRDTTDAAFEKITKASSNLRRHQADAAASAHVARALMGEYEDFVIETLRARIS